MKHAGKARQAGLRLIGWTLVMLALLLVGGVLATIVGSIVAAVATTLIVVWALFAVFTLNFFRDPDPRVPSDPNVFVAPAHGKVDLIDETTEEEFMGGRCRRISIFLSVFDVHVQNAPVSGKVLYFRHCPGKFLNAMRTECSSQNENVLVGFESADAPGERVGVRLIAGLLARRIVPWVAVNDTVERGERISLIQFGSRVDLYLPPNVTLRVKLGDRVKGGETIVAARA